MQYCNAMLQNRAKINYKITSSISSKWSGQLINLERKCAYMNNPHTGILNLMFVEDLSPLVHRVILCSSTK